MCLNWLIQIGQIVLTAEFKINLLRAAKGDRLICRSSVLKPGKLLTIVESEIFSVISETEKLVSKATVSIANVTLKRGKDVACLQFCTR